MFVGIENFKSAIAVENILIPYKKGRMVDGERQPKEKITPQICMQILKSTNNPVNIKRMLECIAELPEVEDVVLASFDNREQPQVIFDLAKKLADANGYTQELENAKILHEGEYFRSSAQLVRDIVTNEAQFIDEDFGKYPPFQKLICVCDPDILYVSVVFADMEKLPKEIEFSSQVVSVQFINCDMKNTKISPVPDCRYVFENVRHLPKDLDIHNSTEVTFKDCDLNGIDGAQLKNVSKVTMFEVCNVPENLDVSQCDNVDILNMDLKSVKNLKFKDGADVCLLAVRNFPHGVDVSHCREFIWSEGSLEGFPPLLFDKDSHVSISNASHMPEEIDVSQCKEVKLLQMIGLLLNVLFLKINCRWKTVMRNFPISGTENLNSEKMSIPLIACCIKSLRKSAVNFFSLLVLLGFVAPYSPIVKAST